MLHLEFVWCHRLEKVGHIIPSMHCFARLGEKRVEICIWQHLCWHWAVASDFKTADTCSDLWKSRYCPWPHKAVSNSSLHCTSVVEKLQDWLAVCMCVSSINVLLCVCPWEVKVQTQWKKISATVVKRFMFQVSHTTWFLTYMGKSSKQDCLSYWWIYVTDSLVSLPKVKFLVDLSQNSLFACISSNWNAMSYLIGCTDYIKIFLVWRILNTGCGLFVVLVFFRTG